MFESQGTLWKRIRGPYSRSWVARAVSEGLKPMFDSRPSSFELATAESFRKSRTCCAILDEGRRGTFGTNYDARSRQMH